MGEQQVNEQELSTVSHVLQNFTSLWFSISMDTGIISILLHQLPYQFHALKIISDVVSLLDLTLFILFLIIFLVRIFRQLRHALHSFATTPEELGGLACPVAAFTILVGIISITGQAWGNGWAVFSYTLLWISAFLAVSVLFSSFYIS